MAENGPSKIWITNLPPTPPHPLPHHRQVVLLDGNQAHRGNEHQYDITPSSQPCLQAININTVKPAVLPAMQPTWEAPFSAV